MKMCAACHEDLPKESYSKKQWKLDQRRCKVCVTNNREVQPALKQNNNDPNTNEITKALDSMYLKCVVEISDEELFKEPPPQLGDCPICFLRLPSLETGYIYQTCCGKVICSGCAYAPVYDDQGNEVDNDKQNKCAFCRTLAPKSIKEIVERLKKRVEADDSFAIHSLGIHYRDGSYGLPQDYNKALELWHRAGELGYAEAYASIGYAYDNGRGLEVDETKAAHYYELAAIRGDEMARHNLGCMEGEAGNTERALKHHMIAVRAGDNDSLKEIQGLYSDGYATKDDYTEALQSYQAYLGEIKSRQRDEAAAADEDHRYY